MNEGFYAREEGVNVPCEVPPPVPLLLSKSVRGDMNEGFHVGAEGDFLCQWARVRLLSKLWRSCLHGGLWRFIAAPDSLSLPFFVIKQEKAGRCLAGDIFIKSPRGPPGILLIYY